ncbi:hypothetical protein KCP77_06640 [Salmonella enterica subsp. enterica]|nr:hypothetical protein KCP77_06640 [Salmonella enterica subsp. enterica]
MPQAFAPVLSAMRRGYRVSNRRAIRITTVGKFPLHRTRNSAPERCNVRFMMGWRVTSYSGLQQRGHSVAQDLIPRSTLTPQALA